MRQDLVRRTDQAFFDELAEVEDEVKLASDSNVLQAQLRRRFGHDMSNDYQVSLRSHGVIFRSERLANHGLPVADISLAVGEQQAETISVEGKPWRLASRSVTGRTGIVLLQVAVSLEGVEHALNELLGVLLIASPITIAGTLGGGYFLARAHCHRSIE